MPVGRALFVFLLAHVAAALLAGRLAQAVNPQAAGRLRWWALGGILPDLIDKPLALFGPAFEGYGRGAGHTLLVVLLLMAVGHRLNTVRAVGFGAATHLLLDAPWTFLAIFAWPLFGLVPAAGVKVGVGGYFAILFGNVHVWAGELVGVAVLLALGVEWFVGRLAVTRPAVRVDVVVAGEADDWRADAASVGLEASETRAAYIEARERSASCLAFGFDQSEVDLVASQRDPMGLALSSGFHVEEA